MMWTVCLATLVAFALAAGNASTSAAQKTDKSDSAESKSKAQAVRLPNYYSRVATETQREKLRDVLKEYAPRIQQKRDELQALIAERDTALEELLTAEQREEITKLRAEAAKRREAGSSDEAKTKTKKSKSAKKAA
jgi:hypothetical protein